MHLSFHAGSLSSIRNLMKIKKLGALLPLFLTSDLSLVFFWERRRIPHSGIRVTATNVSQFQCDSGSWVTQKTMNKDIVQPSVIDKIVTKQLSLTTGWTWTYLK